MVIARVAGQRLFALLLFGLPLPDYFEYFGYFCSFDSLGYSAAKDYSLTRCTGYN